MSDPDALAASLETIGSLVEPEMSQRKVATLFLEAGFYDALGYEAPGLDGRSAFGLSTEQRPDYITVDRTQSVTAVYEFHPAGGDLEPTETELRQYMERLRSEYGLVTNGEQLRLYRRGRDSPVLSVAVESVSETTGRQLTSALASPEFDPTDPDHVARFRADLDPIPLDQQGGVGQAHFFDTVRLEAGSPFADLVVGLLGLLQELRDASDTTTVTEAYDFWAATSASDPEEIPDAWQPFVSDAETLREFMFCLETGHALVARLVLAKTAEDHDIGAGTDYDGITDYVRRLQEVSGTISLDAFPVATVDLTTELQATLVETLFEDDTFAWWTDGYAEQLAGHEAGPSRFEAVAGSTDQRDPRSESARNQISRAVAELVFSVLQFDFEAVEGDLLGALYGQHFDPETRKALGEFYTPQPVVEYIMDRVGYDRGVSTDRLIDPACGSGTFLVEAVGRYIETVERAEDEPDWQPHLEALCYRPRIVGLDIHPFAVLMARVRFVAALLPAYRKAKAATPQFTLRRLPIYRTDALRNEAALSGVADGDGESTQLTLDAVTGRAGDMRIPVLLPADSTETDASETETGGVVRRVRLPQFEAVTAETEIGRLEEYVAALQGVLDTVQVQLERTEAAGSEASDSTYQESLTEHVSRYTSREYADIEAFFEPYITELLETVRSCTPAHDAGWVVTLVENAVLAAAVKNDMQYDYVVGNPPYVRSQQLSEPQKGMLDTLYDSTTGNYDLYCPFYERGIEWLTEDGGTLGYITPNQFMVTEYGAGLRTVLLESRLREITDFRDSGVFADAKTYPAIVIAEDEPDEAARNTNRIRCIRVKPTTDERRGPELDQQVIQTIRENGGELGYSDAYIDVFAFPQQALDAEYWSLMPPGELELIRKLRARRQYTVGEVTDAVFAGTQTSANSVFVVTPKNADRISPDATGETVTVVPDGENRAYEIETDTLRPWLQGRDIDRWSADWAGQHVIVPYSITTTADARLDVSLLSEAYLKEQLPLTWAYLCSHRETLESRENGRFESREDWYAFGYPKSMDRFERPKLIGAEIASEATFMLDDAGRWYFKSAYGVQLAPEHLDRTVLCAGLLNSKLLDFCLKQYTSLKQGGYYKYSTNYLSPLPIAWDDEAATATIRAAVEEITRTLDLDSKTDRFPDAYLGAFDGPLDSVSHEWQTRRQPVSAELQTADGGDGQFTVRVGRSETIRDPAMDAADREAEKRRAEYVRAAVDGRTVTRGEKTTIPIPRSDEDVETLLDELAADRRTIEATSIDELEARIDEAVYELFELTDDEREIVETYLDVF